MSNQNEWKEAIPAGFYLEKDKPGRVYRAKIDGPPMRIKKCEDWDYGDGIAVEYEDMVKQAGGEMLGQEIDSTVRLLFQPSDARFLVVGLIEALATGGDVIAKRLSEVLDQVHEEGPPEE